LASLATIVGRHANQQETSADTDADTGRSVEEIWRSLPWG
jgi:hypothetical protein